MARFADNQTKVAETFSVSRQTVAAWALNSDFPKRTKKGWNLDRIEKWLKENQLGPFRPEVERRADVSPETEDEDEDGSRLTLAEARIKHLQKKSIREDLAIQREQIELETAKGNLLLAEEVTDFHRQLAAVAMTVLDGVPDAIDRELPAKCPSAQAWNKLRRRVVDAGSRIAKDVAAAIEGFIVGGN